MSISPEQFEAALLPQRDAETEPAEPVAEVPEPVAEAAPAETPEATPVETGPEPVEGETAEETAARERDEKGRFLKGKKAASPADVPRIHELTAKMRAAERERDEYRQKWEAIQNERTAPAQNAPRTRQDAPETQIGDFTDAEPKLEDFASEPDAYAEWVTARAEWRIRKSQHAEALKREEASVTQWVQQQVQAYQQREQTFRASHPDWDELITSSPNVVNPVLAAAIQLDPDGPALLYNLLKQQDKFYEIHLLTAGKPVEPVTVQTVQALLKTRLNGAVTASPALANGKKPLPTPLKAVPSGPITRHPGSDDSEDEPFEAFYQRRKKAARQG